MNDAALEMAETAVAQAEIMPPYECSEDDIIRLATLPLFEYEKIRIFEADRLGVRVSVLDAEVKKEQQKAGSSSGDGSLFPKVEPWLEPVNGAELLDSILATVQRFIICEPETAKAATLWIAFTWFVDYVQVAPLAVITAPEKRCGKTQMLSLISMLSCRPLMGSNISSAAVYRVIEAHSPTLFIDEADSFIQENEELRGVINSGHTRQAAYVIRTVGEDHEPKQFSTWGAKAISGIGKLSETLMDRAIILELRRKLPSEEVARLRHAEAGLFKQQASMLARWALDFGQVVGSARPALPEALNDRAQDNWEPLLAIADHAGGHWPETARSVALKMSCTDSAAVSISAELLSDICEIFKTTGNDRIASIDLLFKLNDLSESPWATFNRGKWMTARQLAKLLREYGIKSHTVRIGAETPKGFMLSDFEDAFTRYLYSPMGSPTETATPQQRDKESTFSKPSSVSDNPQRCCNENPSATLNGLENMDCFTVADEKGDDDMAAFL